MTQPDFSGTFEGRFVDDDNLRESGRVWLEFDNGGGEMSVPISQESINAALAEISVAGEEAVQRAIDESAQTTIDTVVVPAIEGARDEALNEADLAIQAAKDANSVSRVAALEAMNGVSPESPVDGQTANLVLQGDSLTRAAISGLFAEDPPGSGLFTIPGGM